MNVAPRSKSSRSGFAALRPGVLLASLGLPLLIPSLRATERFVAGSAAGDAHGTSASNAASYLDVAFWQSVNADASKETTTVHFLEGHYHTGEFTLTALGNEKYRLALVGEGSGAVFDNDGDFVLYIRGCRNVLFKNLHFTGNAAKFGVTVTGITSERKDAIIPVVPTQMQVENVTYLPARDLEFDGCSWIDLHNAFYGALCLSSNSSYISVHDCTFKRVGLERHAHMMYNGAGSHHLFIYRNVFEDCAGSYVRFRNRSDYGYVFNNTFRSTGTLTTEDSSTSTFLQVPLYNSFDPGEETFGTNFYVIGNSFNWAANPVKRDVHDPIDQINFHARDAIRFHQGGFETRGFHTLLSKDEGYTLGLGAPSSKLPILLNAGIHPDRIIWYGNAYAGPMQEKAAYGCLSEFGAFPKSRGFDTYADITNALTQREMFREGFERDENWTTRWTVTQDGNAKVMGSFNDAMEGHRSLLLENVGVSSHALISRAIDPVSGFYFSAWFYFNENTADHLCFGDGKKKWVVAARSGFWENDRGRCIGSGPYVANKWYHVEVGLEQGARDYSIWVDGVLISKDIKDPVEGPVRKFEGPIQFSSGVNGTAGSMLMDDVRFSTLGEQAEGVRLVRAQRIDDTTLEVEFSAPVDVSEGEGGAASATNPSNYMVSGRFFPAYDIEATRVVPRSSTVFQVKTKESLPTAGAYVWVMTLRSERGSPLSSTERFLKVATSGN